MSSYYEILEVSRRATPETIRAAFRSLLQRHHPDKHGACADAQRRTRLLLEAYEVLADEARRRACDARPASSELHAARAAATRPAGSAARFDWRPWLWPALGMGWAVAMSLRLKLALVAMTESLGASWTSGAPCPAGHAAIALLLAAPAMSLITVRRPLLWRVPIIVAGLLAASPAGADCVHGSLDACLLLGPTSR
ncbi:MAG TPA: J domain-containing protein [Nevskiaceae bacterium]|nr:J domain-containing protein [Nevskiaceae bacterium]